MTIYEMANYYYNRTPRLWDKSRLEALVSVGRLTQDEYLSIIEESDVQYLNIGINTK